MPDLTAIKIRLYPNSQQRDQLDRTFGCCRFLWNQMLNEHQVKYQQYKLDGIKSKYKTEAEYKKDFSFLREADSKALQNVSWNLQEAFSRFFRNCRDRKTKKTKLRVGLPHFKSRHKAHNSYTTDMINNNIKIDFVQRTLQLPKFKSPIKYSDPRVFNEKIRSVTVSKTKSGRYYASIIIARENPITPMASIHEEKVVAFDMSMKDFLVTKDYKLSNPRFFRNTLHKIVKSHRKVSRSQKKSKNRAKACKHLAKVYEHYINQKNDWTHKITKKLADQYDAVILEDLNIKGMSRMNKGYAKNVTKDFSWGEFSTILSYKMQRKGKHLVKVGRFFPSSQLCSACGFQYKALMLDQREWTCPKCHVHHDRDINASQNLRKEGLRLLSEMGITLIRATVGTTESYACRDCVSP
jgi:putative transposase